MSRSFIVGCSTSKVNSQVFPFLLVFWLLAVWVPAAEAKLPPPAPKVFANYLLDSKCADGSDIRARLSEQRGALWLDRENCKNRKPLLIIAKLPSGGNAIETNLLVYEGKLFEETHDSDQHTILFCRSEAYKIVRSGGVKAVVRTTPQGNGFILSLSEASSFYWSAVEAQLEDGRYSGHGNINPQEFISLDLTPRGARAKATYMFEVGVGRIGERAQTRGSVDNLRCYRP